MIELSLAKRAHLDWRPTWPFEADDFVADGPGGRGWARIRSNARPGAAPWTWETSSGAGLRRGSADGPTEAALAAESALDGRRLAS